MSEDRERWSEPSPRARDPDSASSGEPPPGGRATADRPWARPVVLFAIVMALSVTQPIVVVGIPLGMLVLILPTSNVSGVLAGVAAAVLAFAIGPRGGLWFVERGWVIVLSGWFLALTLKWPGSSFLPRALASVLGATAVLAVGFLSDPGAWLVLDWMVEDRMQSGVAAALEVMRRIGGDGGALSQGLVTTVYETAELQARVFPALLGLESIAALGVAWWMYVRLAHGATGALSPLREFRFNDQLVWLLIGGLLLVLVNQGDHWTRAGSNTLVFMGGLYAVRGVAVVAFVSGGLSLFGGILLFFSLVFVAPLVLGAALVIGIGDTWLDVRERVRQLAA